jgi:hypothetical protein
VSAATTLEAAAKLFGRQDAFAFLTLDVVQAFYDLMGLNVEAQSRLGGVLRGATLATRKALVDALVNGKAPPTLASFCEKVETAGGAGLTEHLAWWLGRMFDAETRTHRALRHWTDVLHHCRREGDESWRRLRFPLPLSEEVAQRLATALDRTEHDRRCAAVEARPLSDWDLHMHASQLYDFDDDLEGTGMNLSNHISETVSACQGYRFWAWLVRALEPEEQTRLREQALEVVRTDELTWIKDLVHPSALDIGP